MKKRNEGIHNQYQMNKNSSGLLQTTVQMNTEDYISFNPRKGLAIQDIKNFIEQNPSTLENLTETLEALIAAQDKNERIVRLRQVHDIVTNCSLDKLEDVIYLLRLICILNLQKQPLIVDPRQILKEIITSVPDKYHTVEIIEKLVDEIYKISEDRGDRLHLCYSTLSLGSTWACLTRMLAWRLFCDIYDVQDLPEANLTNLKEILSSRNLSRSLIEVDMIVRLINILLRKFAEEDEINLIWIKQWILESSDLIRGNYFEGRCE